MQRACSQGCGGQRVALGLTGRPRRPREPSPCPTDTEQPSDAECRSEQQAGWQASDGAARREAEDHQRQEPEGRDSRTNGDQECVGRPGRHASRLLAALTDPGPALTLRG